MESERSGATRRPPPDLLYTPLDKTSVELGRHYRVLAGKPYDFIEIRKSDE